MQYNNDYIIAFAWVSSLQRWTFPEVVLISLLHEQCDVIRTLPVSNVNTARFLASCTLQMWINLTKICFEGIYFSYFVYIVVIILCRILRFWYGGSFLELYGMLNANFTYNASQSNQSIQTNCSRIEYSVIDNNVRWNNSIGWFTFSNQKWGLVSFWWKKMRIRGWNCPTSHYWPYMTIFDTLWGKLSRMHVQFDKTSIWNIFYFWTMRFNDKLNNILEILTWRPSFAL